MDIVTLLDVYCARMMAVQVMANCSVHDLTVGEIVVLRGNSLMPFEEMDTILFASAPGIEVIPAQAPARRRALAAAAQTHPDVVQLELFEAA